MSKGFTDMTVFPGFIESLKTIVAPKSRLNVAKGIIDFVDFLVEDFGPDGPNKNVMRHPASIKEIIDKYCLVWQNSAKERQQTQTMLDWDELPTTTQLATVKVKLLQMLEGLLDKGIKRGNLTEEDYNLVMKSLICVLVFRTACRSSTAIHVKFEHFCQLVQADENDYYFLPLKPVKAFGRRKLAFFQFQIFFSLHCWKYFGSATVTSFKVRFHLFLKRKSKSESQPSLSCALQFLCFRGEKKSETIQRVMAQMTASNKNYRKEGKKCSPVAKSNSLISFWNWKSWWVWDTPWSVSETKVTK